MSDRLLNSFDRSVSGINESLKVVKDMANIALRNEVDPRVIANKLDKVALNIASLATKIRSEALDPLYDYKNAFIASPEIVADDLVKYGSNSG